MKRTVYCLCSIAALTAGSQPSFAQQNISGGGSVAINATGIAQGVAITGNTTLTVGTVGGPQTDIFTNNAAGPFTSPAVSTGASSQGNIVFNSASTVNGAIGVTQPGGPFLLNITTAAGNAGTVTFNGPVFATQLFANGTGTVNFNSGSINQTPGGEIFGGDGTISLAPNTTLIGALTTAAGTNTGTLVLGGGSALTGAIGAASASLKNITVAGGSNLAGVSASVSGAVFAYGFNLNTNTLNIGGQVTIADNTTSGFVNTTLASPTVYGNIRVTGATNLGARLGVNVTVPSTAVIPVGTQFNIVQTTSGTVQSGTPGTVLAITVVNPTNPLYTFSAVPPAGTVAGLVAIRTDTVPLEAPVVVPPPLPITPIAAPLVPVLLALPGTAGFLAPIDALTDAAAVVSAEAQLAPSTVDLVAPRVTFRKTREFQNLWYSRLDEVLCNQVGTLQKTDPACQGVDQRSGWWAKGFGYYGNQGNQDIYPGYQSKIGGAMMAYDVPVAPNTRAGAGIGYARSQLDSKMFIADTSINSYQLTAYVGHENGPWFAYGDVSFGYNDYSGSRRVSFPGFDQTAKAGYSGQDYTTYGTAGYHFSAPQGITITPLVSLQYTHVNVDGYTETGSSDINLKVASQSYDFLESGLGAKAARDFAYQGKVFVPEIHARWLREIINPTMQENAAFAIPGSASFTTAGLKIDPNTFNIGTGISLLDCSCSARNWSLEGVYDYEWRTDGYSSHQATLRLTGRF